MNTSEAGFTEGPWRLAGGTGATEIRGEPTGDVPNPRVCRVLHADPNANANARRIVQCANSHDEMLAALRDLLREVRKVNDVLLPDGFDARVIRAAEYAIAKAEAA